MGEKKLTRIVTVNNPEGLHVRPCDLISKLARKYQAQIEIVNGKERVDAKSILSLLAGAATARQGAQLTIEAMGDDANDALDALVILFDSNFALES
jgi:phosphocarrier protein